MQDYEPLDLTLVCNTGPEPFGPNFEPPLGAQTFQGLPFQIGGEIGKPCFLGFGPEPPLSAEPISLSVGQSARNVLCAHALRDTHLHEGDPPGRVIARYRFVFADGEQVTVPIRERFEIGVIPVAWGELPFLARTDRKDSLMDRYQGEWGGTGFRQTEARQAWPNAYYLWAWKNPRPEVALERIEIHPGDGESPTLTHRFLVAAVTLGHRDEEPFWRNAGVPVKLTLPQPEDAKPPFALSVEVDRGVATYPYALPEQSAEAFLQAPHQGFGEGQNPQNSPAYVEIAAIPSATVTVKRAEEELGSAPWGALEEQGVVETPRVRFELLDTGRNWVHTTVVDDATGKPIPCRVHFRTPAGVPYAPHGHHPHVNSNLGTWHIDVGGDVRLGQISYAYIDGKCQGWLPRGEVIVDVARGYEYEPLRAKVEIKPGQRELTLRLKRHSDLNAERYFSGDTHVHFLSTQGAITEAAAEDLDVVNLLLSQWGHLYTNTEEFIGRPVASGDGETIVYATQENRQHLLGHLTLLGLKEPVMPWCSDGPSEAELGGNLETTLSHWADACHAQGGTVVIPHLPNPNGEPAALIATGRADAVEMLVHNPFFHLEYYRYLNGGYRLPLAGGTDKMDSGVPVGLYRTYAHIPAEEPFTYNAWCKALRAGNTFLSGGPLLRFSVNGQPIGSTVQLSGNGGTVEVEAVATSIFPIHALEIVQGAAPGSPQSEIFHVVASTEERNGAKALRLKATLKIERTTWLCARCAGPDYTAVPHHDSWRRGIMAHTSPVYLACSETYDLFDPRTAHYMLTLLDGSLQHIRQRAPQWRPGTTTHHHGEADHQAFLERPFHQAIAALHHKLHEHGIPH
ncbi:MAG TPA: CehA/McbA family metallohydrolase [Chthonomonadaceae bacterium]|nr:CehA/McbA family metallohydrolase [Chthonomonadaceae bacterium]